MTRFPSSDHQAAKDRLCEVLLSRLRPHPDEPRCWVYHPPEGGDNRCMEVHGKRHTAQRLVAYVFRGRRFAFHDLDEPGVRTFAICGTPHCCTPAHVRVRRQTVAQEARKAA